jgi:hypothetical protein
MCVAGALFNMWKLRSNDLLQFRGAGGERFAQFVDQLIRAEALTGGLSQSEVLTQLRVNIGDGGVDSQVRKAIPKDVSGWFSVPTCWQYKAVEAKDINDKKYKKKKNQLQEAIHEPYVEELIGRGFGYRFCVLGDLTAKKVEEWEAMLGEEARRICSDAAAACVVDGSQLLAWAARFPAVVASLTGSTLEILNWDAWTKDCRAVTEVYVANPLWNHFRLQMLEHANLDTSRPLPTVPCFAIGGGAGVGKTRLIFEALQESKASPGLVVYAPDEQAAKTAAVSLVNNAGQTLIIVADECSSETRFLLNEILKGHRDRIRVFCLDNTASKSQADVWLSHDSIKQTTIEILNRNFEHVPEDRRLLYSEQSKGFVRLAADMCYHDSELTAGDKAGLTRKVRDYVQNRLADRLAIVSLIALFHKIGFKDDVSADLAALTAIADRSRQDFIETASVVRESPGFLVQAGRYWYVTPEIVARDLFLVGWRRWVEPDIALFLEGLPPHLLQQFVERVGWYGDEEVRVQLVAYFRGWFASLTPPDLVDPKVAALVAALVETKPESYLLHLRNLIEQADSDTLLRLEGDRVGDHWGPRRSVVWLLERLVAFPEFFDDCEACLFRLAMHETESRIGNNATQIWRNLFSVYLSGTAAPFAQRVTALKNRVSSPSLEESRLAFRGVDHVFAGASGHIVGPREIAGRLRPIDWQPGSSAEEHACFQTALRLCGESMKGGDHDRRAFAFDVLVDHIDFILRQGLLGEISTIIRPGAIGEEESRRLLHAVEEFLSFERQYRRDRLEDPCFQAVASWIETFRPSDFDGTLRSVCSRDLWDDRFANDPSKERDETDDLAEQIRANPSRLIPHLDWLAGHEARSAERLGFALGRIDETDVCGKTILQHAIDRRVAPLLRGYVRGLVFAARRPSPALLSLVSELEQAAPAVAVDILVFGGDSFDALDRVVSLVESHAVGPRFLASFAIGIGRRTLTVAEVGRLLPYFIDAALNGDGDAARAGLRFLFSQLMSQNRRPPEDDCFEAEHVRVNAWRLIDAALPHMERRVSREWSQIVERLSQDDIGRAANVFVKAMTNDDPELWRQAQTSLVQLASKDPAAVMEALGPALRDPDQSWWLHVNALRDLISQLPPRSLVAWVKTHGVKGARAIARHLPFPYLDQDGHPIVPEVLDTILREFDDRQVLENFTAGAHSGESWWGDSTEKFRRDAEIARRFLTHPNRRIREWAMLEIEQRTQMAEREELEHAESVL